MFVRRDVGVTEEQHAVDAQCLLQFGNLISHQRTLEIDTGDFSAGGTGERAEHDRHDGIHPEKGSRRILAVPVV